LSPRAAKGAATNRPSAAFIWFNLSGAFLSNQLFYPSIFDAYAVAFQKIMFHQ
jgi:hypothetical protein